jgi:hypothetical protein
VFGVEEADDKIDALVDCVDGVLSCRAKGVQVAPGSADDQNKGPSRYARHAVLGIEAIGALNFVVATVKWFVNDAPVAVVAGAFGLLLLGIAVLISRARARDLFVPSLLVFAVGLLLTGAAAGHSLDSSPELPMPSPSSSGTWSPSPPSPPSTSCPTAPYGFRQSTVVGSMSQPGADARVAKDVNIKGAVQAVPAGYTLWTVSEVVGPAGHPYWEKFKCQFNRLWPGPMPVKVGSDGRWNTLMTLGGVGPEHSQLRHRVTLVIADAQATALFEGFNKTASMRYAGIETSTLAGAIERVTTVEVIRM